MTRESTAEFLLMRFRCSCLVKSFLLETKFCQGEQPGNEGGFTTAPVPPPLPGSHLSGSSLWKLDGFLGGKSLQKYGAPTVLKPLADFLMLVHTPAPANSSKVLVKCVTSFWLLATFTVAKAKLRSYISLKADFLHIMW